MERESNPMQALCRSGCGFYGSPATDGLCSLCFKENLKKKQQLPSAPASLSALRETATAQPTINHLPSSPVADLPTDPQAREGVLEDGQASRDSVGRRSEDELFYDVPEGEGAQLEASEESSGQPQSTSGTAGGQTTPSDAESEASSAAAAGVDPDSSSEEKDGDKDFKKKKNRCFACRKKVGLTGFECRCGGLFCAVHRYSDKHDCSFNYREMGAQEIRRNNPVVVGEKIQKI